MANGQVKIGSYWYDLARDSLLPSGARRWQIGGEPAQPSPGVSLQYMEWELSGPHFNSGERIVPGAAVGYLGTDYTEGCDTRTEGKLQLGPIVNNVDLSSVGGTAANTNCYTRSYDMNATEFIYIGRGTKWAKIDALGSGFTHMSPVTEASAATAERITSLLFTRTPGGTQEISVGMRGTAYRVITAVANAGSDDTHAANSSSVINSVMMLGPDRVFGAQDVASATPATLRGNILTGSVTMAAPAWATNATLPGHKLKVNSLGLDGNFVVVGTNRGPQMLDPQYNQFRDLALEIDTDAKNCAAMGNWQPYGLTYSLRYASRTQYGGNSVSDGPENFPTNTSPVGLRLTAVCGSDRWQYRAYYNETTGNTHILAGRPRQANDPHDNPMSFYCFAVLTSKVCEFLGYIGTMDGLLTYPLLIGGYGTDYFYVGTEGGGVNGFVAPYVASTGTWYGTESRREAHLMKDICAIELETANTTSGYSATLTFALSTDGGSSYTSLSGGLSNNGVVATAGMQRLLPISDAGVPLSAYSGRHFKPKITLARGNGVGDPPPYAAGKLRIHYRPRPIISQTLQFTVVLDKSTGPGLSVTEAQAALITAWGAGPVVCENPDDGLTASYIRVDRVDVTEVQDKNPDRDRSAGAVRVATVHAFVWPTASGQ